MFDGFGFTCLPAFRSCKDELACRFLSCLCSCRFVIVPALLDRAVFAKSVLAAPAYWDSVGLQEGARMFAKGFLLDTSVMGGAKSFPLLSFLAGVSLIWLVLKTLWTLTIRQSLDRRALTVLFLFVASFLLFCGKSAFGKFVNLLPFSRSIVPFSEFFLHFQMIAVLLIGWALSDVKA